MLIELSCESSLDQMSNTYESIEEDLKEDEEKQKTPSSNKKIRVQTTSSQTPGKVVQKV